MADRWLNDLIEYLSGNNAAPTAPSVNYPEDDGEVVSVEPVLSINNANDSDGDTLVYDFEIYDDSDLGNRVASVSGVEEGLNTTAWQVDTILEDNSFYYWRARASDGILDGAWMSTAKFFVNSQNDPPSVPTVSGPPDGSEVAGAQPILEITNAHDLDLDPLTYEFEVYTDQEMTLLEASETSIPQGSSGATSWQVPLPLQDNTSYWWRAQARDDEGLEGGWTDSSMFFVNTANDAPLPPAVRNPEEGSEVDTVSPVLIIDNSTDADLDVLTYQFEIDRADTFDTPSYEQSGEVVEGQEGTTSWQPSELDDNAFHHWRARAFDGAAYSPWSSGSFFVNLVNDAPDTPTITNPNDGGEVGSPTPALEAAPSFDLDRDRVVYDFEVYGDENPANLVTSVSGADQIWQVDVPLDENRTYSCRVRAVDEHGAASSWSPSVGFTVNTTNEIPTAPSVNSPVSGGTVTSVLPTLSVNNSTDPDDEILTYDFEIYSDRDLSNRVDSEVVNQGDTITSWTVSQELNDNTLYYWRSRADDGQLAGGWMPTAVLLVETEGADTTVIIEASRNISASEPSVQIVKVTLKDSPIKGVRVEIPQGAVPYDCIVTIGRVVNPPALPPNTKALGPTLMFGPEDLEFEVPISILVPYSQEDLENADVTDPSELEFFTYDPLTLEWLEIPLDDVDRKSGLLVYRVDHFSMFAMGKSLAEPSGSGSEGGGGGGGGCFLSTLLSANDS
jgi:transposase-like protein